ncbi:hypothetical protein THOM_1129, partial [Trachipleistophora hominis]
VYKRITWECEEIYYRTHINVLYESITSVSSEKIHECIRIRAPLLIRINPNDISVYVIRLTIMSESN